MKTVAALSFLLLFLLAACQGGAEAAAPASAAGPKPPEETVSGLRSQVLRPGSGTKHPERYDRVRILYVARTHDGRVFDGTQQDDRPRSFAVRDLFFGWSEGVRLMVAGERRRLWIPEPLVIDGQLPAPWPVPSGDLVIDVDLVQIEPGVAPPQTPEALSAPESARRTPSGLAYERLQAGTGKRHPAASDRVRIAYAAWTSRGVLFRSSQGDEPTTTRVSALIPGWAEGVRLMVEGEKTRFWIPEPLAYEGQEGQPAGELTFDVHLVEILRAAGEQR